MNGCFLNWYPKWDGGQNLICGCVQYQINNLLKFLHGNPTPYHIYTYYNRFGQGAKKTEPG